MADKAEGLLVKTVFQDISDRQAKGRARREASYIGTLLRTYRKRKGTRILNVGCGLGRHDGGLRRLGYTVNSIQTRKC